ncbi:MAG: 3-dehydroquinate synthase [Isosphaeraceae bacterium]
MTSDAPPSMTPSDSEIRVPVNLGPRSYEIRVVSGKNSEFGAFARSALDATWAGRTCRKALIVTDENVKHRVADYVARLADVGIAANNALIEPGESSKSLDHACDLFDELIKMRADRHTVVVALGGGVVGDLAGFVAATYARGVPLLMVPTTLLSQVDSAVGGKVGVNHPRAKNIIGSFHQPVGVWCDTEALATLPQRELRCGLAEVVKYGVILDQDFFASLEGEADAILAGEPSALRRIVAESCRLKAAIVERDEREETGLRAVLNFGHTIGHAIESVAGYDGPFRHGEAVAVGMVAESRLAERIGWLPAGQTSRLVALLERFGLPTRAPGLDHGALVEAMSRDKKNQKGKTRFVLPRTIGRVELTDLPSPDDVRAVLNEL